MASQRAAAPAKWPAPHRFCASLGGLLAALAAFLCLSGCVYSNGPFLNDQNSDEPFSAPQSVLVQDSTGAYSTAYTVTEVDHQYTFQPTPGSDGKAGRPDTIYFRKISDYYYLAQKPDETIEGQATGYYLYLVLRVDGANQYSIAPLQVSDALGAKWGLVQIGLEASEKLVSNWDQLQGVAIDSINAGQLNWRSYTLSADGTPPSAVSDQSAASDGDNAAQIGPPPVDTNAAPDSSAPASANGAAATGGGMVVFGVIMLVLLGMAGGVVAVVVLATRRPRPPPIMGPYGPIAPAPPHYPSAPPPVRPVPPPVFADDDDERSGEPISAGDRPTPHDVFISHSSKDKSTADALCAILEREGLRCWMAPRDITPGEEWAQAVVRGINGARAFVLVFSHFSNASAQVRREVERAANHEIPIIPFRIEDITPNQTLEFFISTPHWMDAFSPPMEAHIQRLATAVKRLVH